MYKAKVKINRYIREWDRLIDSIRLTGVITHKDHEQMESKLQTAADQSHAILTFMKELEA